jgi:glc operon protein GlcG
MNYLGFILSNAMIGALAVSTASAQVPVAAPQVATSARDSGGLKTATAIRIVEAARKFASENGLRLSIIALDAYGHFVAGVRMDGAPFVTSEVARGKAFAVVATGGVPGDELAKRFAENPQVWSNASSLGWGAPLLPSRGAYPVYIGGVLVGAVGASGAPSEMDEKAIIAGITNAGVSAGLKPE